MYVRMYVCMCVCMYVCRYVCVYIYVYMDIVTFQEPIPIVEMFLADYLQMWNGYTYQKEILQLISCSLHLQHFEGTDIMHKNLHTIVPFLWPK